MYIEVFLLDNMLMDWLILRLAAALGGYPLAPARTIAGSLGGALYALGAVFWPLAGGLVGKVAAGCLLALALSPRSWRDYGMCLLCLFAAAFVAGGFALALALSTGGTVRQGAVWGGLPLRTGICVALGVSFLPGAARRILYRRRSGRLRLALEYGGQRYELEAIIDSGSSLYDPLTSLPVIVAHIPALAPDAHIPVPIKTVQGNGILFAFKPQSITLNGRPVKCLVGLSPSPLQGTEALVPPGALPAAIGE